MDLAEGKGEAEIYYCEFRIMGKLQRDIDLSEEEVQNITVFYESLSADISNEVKKSPFEK